MTRPFIIRSAGPWSKTAMERYVLMCLGIMLTALLSPPGHADGTGNGSGDNRAPMTAPAQLASPAASPMPQRSAPTSLRDHDLVRDLVRRGEIWSLDRIIAQIQWIYADVREGKLIQMNFDPAHRTYDVTLLSKDGNMLRAKVDAVSGQVLETQLARSERKWTD